MGEQSVGQSSRVPSGYQCPLVCLLCFFFFPFLGKGAALPPISIDFGEHWYCLQEHARFLKTEDRHLDAQEAYGLLSRFSAWDEISINHREKDVWAYFEIKNPHDFGDSIYMNGQLTDYTTLFEVRDGCPVEISESGFMYPFERKPVKAWGSIVSAYVHPGKVTVFLIRFRSMTQNSRRLLDYVTVPCMKVFTKSGFRHTYQLPRTALYFFLGAIAMMAVYNLSISISTQYREYLLFSLYNILTVIAAFLICGLHHEQGWVRVFDFERNLKYLPAVLLAPSYLWFAVYYLDLKLFSKRVYHAVALMALLYIVIIAALLMSWFQFSFISFTILTGISFSTVLTCAVILCKTNRSARFFLAGNVIICSVSLLQLASFYSLITTRQMTVGTMAILVLEIITFSFAVAYKLKTSRREILDMRFQNEIQQNRLALAESLRKRLHSEIEKKSRALTTSSIQWLNLSDRLNKLEEKILSSLAPEDHEANRIMLKEIRSIKRFKEEWNTFKLHFEQVHPDFFEVLENKHAELTSNDLKICAFMKMKFSNKEIATILNVTKKAVEQAKRRMRKKMGLAPEEDIMKHIDGLLGEASNIGDSPILGRYF